jgi:hypothetical protein
MLTLQELCYLNCSDEQRKQFPIMMQRDIKIKLQNRIVKIWRRSKRGKLYLMKKFYKEGIQLTKKCIILLLADRFLKEQRNVLEFTRYLHNYFHEYETETELTDEQLDTIFQLFRQINAHHFFARLFSFSSVSEETELTDEIVRTILSALDKKTLLKMYSLET